MRNREGGMRNLKKGNTLAIGQAVKSPFVPLFQRGEKWHLPSNSPKALLPLAKGGREGFPVRIPHLYRWSGGVDLYRLIVAQFFRLHLLAAAHADEFGVDFFSNLIDGQMTQKNSSGIDVDVIFHDGAFGRISGHFNYRNDWMALRGAPPGGKNNEVGPGCGQSGHDLGLLSRGIENKEASFGNNLSIFQDAGNRHGTGFTNRAERFFLDGGNAPPHISG